MFNGKSEFAQVLSKRKIESLNLKKVIILKAAIINISISGKLPFRVPLI